MSSIKQILKFPKKTNKSKRKKEFEKKLKEYAKILKDDFDWDYGYIIKLLLYKLKRTRECLVRNNVGPDTPKIEEQIKEVEFLLSRFMEDDYDQCLDDFHEKYGELQMIPGEKVKGGVIVATVFEKETPENRDEIHSLYRELRDKAEQMKQDDLTKAFNLLGKNIQNWWD